MSPLRLVACAAVLLATQAASAIQPAGGGTPPRPAPAGNEMIERGGTVDGIDLARQAILVDGIVYAIPRGSVRIHLPPNRVSTSLSDLKRGMQIRFTSQKDFGAQLVQVREIWVTGARMR
jgi:hypothetical protein